MALPDKSEPPEADHVRRARLEDGRIALVRIRHRLQRIQEEMEAINRRVNEASARRKSR
jgi:hypothetical protein